MAHQTIFAKKKEGITQENCAAEGYNLTCVKQLSEMTRGSAPPALLYGEVQRGWGVNRNCGDDVPKGSSLNCTWSYQFANKPFERAHGEKFRRNTIVTAHIHIFFDLL